MQTVTKSDTTETDMNNTTNNSKSMTSTKSLKEIDILALLYKVWNHKKELKIFLAVFFVMGIVVALSRQKSYTSQVILAPEATSMGMSQNLSDIAGAIGVDIGGGRSSVDAIYPDIYPDVFASSDFIIKLFDIPVTVNGKQKTYYNHIIQDTKAPFWEYPKYWILELLAKKEPGGKGNTVNPRCLTKQQSAVCDAIIGSIGCQINKTTNVITLSVTDTDPTVAACMADSIKSRLQEYITLYRTEKARQDLRYSKRINAEAKAEYEKAREAYSSYSDAYSNAVLMSYRSKIEGLENEMQLKFNNYSQTIQQVQKAEAKVQENTPAFTVIQNATVPLKASSTPRMLTVIMFTAVGFLFDAAWVLILRPMLRRKK